MSAIFAELVLPNGRRLVRPRKGASAQGSRILFTETFAPYDATIHGTNTPLYTVEVELAASGEVTFKVLDPAPTGMNTGSLESVRAGVKVAVKAAGTVLSRNSSHHRLCFVPSKVGKENQLTVIWNAPQFSRLKAAA